jgi:hypothetical protein
MTRGVWAAVAVCAVAAGCNSPQYYTAPPEKLPPAVNVGGAQVQITDHRPEWEKKPFTGTVCLYHLDKAQPGCWAQLAEEANAVVEAMPQKPEKVEIEVTSFRLVRSGITGKRYQEVGNANAPAADPRVRFRGTQRLNDEFRQRRDERNGTAVEAPDARMVSDKNGPDIELAFAAGDDPRVLLRDHPSGASCALKARVKMTFPGGRQQTADVSTFARAGNETGTAYWGEAVNQAARTAVQQFGDQFRTAAGVKAESQPLLSSGEGQNRGDVSVRPSAGP